MRWFRLNKSFYASGDTGSYNAYYVVTLPVLYNNEVYGTENNPMYRVHVKGGVVTIDRSVYPVRDYEVFAEAYRIVGSRRNSDLSGSWGEEITGDYISGKYRFSSIISGGIYGGWGIPLNYAIQTTDGDEVVCDYLRAISGNDRYPNNTYCGFYFGNIKNNRLITMGSRTAGETTFDVPTKYKNFVIDFGATPQPIPKFIKDFIEVNATAIYPYSYQIKDYDGNEVLAEITDAPPMKNALLTVVGSQKTLILTGTNDRTYNLTWNSISPEGENFLGLSTSSNSNRVAVPADKETGVSWVGDLVFYESYGKYRPPATTFDINLYQNSAEVNRVDKSNYLVGVGTLSGALRDECSMLTPSIVFQSLNVPTFNYVYIPIFNRYYFVTSLSSVSKNVWRMELNCDVLMTYKQQIFLLQGVIGRQEIDFNPMLIDSEVPTQDNPDVTVVHIPSRAFKSHTNVSDNFYNFVLTVIG